VGGWGRERGVPTSTAWGRNGPRRCSPGVEEFGVMTGGRSLVGEEAEPLVDVIVWGGGVWVVAGGARGVPEGERGRRGRREDCRH
jgi:hypothetical protein